jgi:hypothetical protein
MNTATKLFITILLSISFLPVVHAEDEFYGVVESHPDNRLGIWIVGKRSVEVTEDTEFEEENGPVIIGVCVEVEVEDGIAEEIDSEPEEKCAK